MNGRKEKKIEVSKFFDGKQIMGIKTETVKKHGVSKNSCMAPSAAFPLTTSKKDLDAESNFLKAGLL